MYRFLPLSYCGRDRFWDSFTAIKSQLKLHSYFTSTLPYLNLCAHIMRRSRSRSRSRSVHRSRSRSRRSRSRSRDRARKRRRERSTSRDRDHSRDEPRRRLFRTPNAEEQQQQFTPTQQISTGQQQLNGSHPSSNYNNCSECHAKHAIFDVHSWRCVFCFNNSQQPTTNDQKQSPRRPFVQVFRFRRSTY